MLPPNVAVSFLLIVTPFAAVRASVRWNVLLKPSEPAGSAQATLLNKLRGPRRAAAWLIDTGTISGQLRASMIWAGSTATSKVRPLTTTSPDIQGSQA